MYITIREKRLLDTRLLSPIISGNGNTLRVLFEAPFQTLWSRLCGILNCPNIVLECPNICVFNIIVFFFLERALLKLLFQINLSLSGM